MESGLIIQSMDKLPLSHLVTFPLEFFPLKVFRLQDSLYGFVKGLWAGPVDALANGLVLDSINIMIPFQSISSGGRTFRIGSDG